MQSTPRRPFRLGHTQSDGGCGRRDLDYREFRQGIADGGRPRNYNVQGGGDRPQAHHEVGWRPIHRPDLGRAEHRAAGEGVRFNLASPEARNDPGFDRSSRPLVKPERFDGSEDWNSYIQHFEWCAELNGWNEREKAKFLTVSVTGTARQVLAGVTREKLRDY